MDPSVAKIPRTERECLVNILIMHEWYFNFLSVVADSDGPFALRKVGAGLYGVLRSEFQTHEVGIVPNLGLFRPSKI